MALSRIQTWTLILSACLTWICISQAAAGPQYMVTIPAVIEAGSETMFCVDFMQPTENLTITIFLVYPDNKNSTIFQKTTDQPFHHSGLFQALKIEQMLSLEVVVQGHTFLSREVRKIMFRTYKPLTFIQTDKPIYFPGQTVKFRIFTMNTTFMPINQLYNMVEIEDAHGNRIGQWVNQMSNESFVEHSYPLNPEAHEGPYRVIVHVDDVELDHYFKVEKYVLPRFDVKLEAHDKISIEQEEFTAKVCATYTHGQPVPGMIEVELCRPLDADPKALLSCLDDIKAWMALSFLSFNEKKTEVVVFAPNGSGNPPLDLGPLAQFVKPTVSNLGFKMDNDFKLDRQISSVVKSSFFHLRQLAKTCEKGCGTFTFNMSTFTTPAQKSLDDKLQLNAKVEEDGTGIALSAQEKVISRSSCIGYLSFIETPMVYKDQSVIEGKVKARYLNHTPIPDMMVYLFEGQIRSTAHTILTVKTDSNGEASFSFNTSDSKADPGQDIFLTASATPELQYHMYTLVPHYEEGEHQLSLVQEATGDPKTVSSLEVKSTGNPLICNGENNITIHYIVVGETAGPVDLMYLILSRGAIRHQGLVTIDVLNSSVTDGEISFQLDVTPVMAPLLQVLVYAILPSATVIAHSADFTTEKCFHNKVVLEFSPSTAIPGEKNTLQVSATAGSLCGVSAIDKSVHIKEPEKRLDADKIFDRLPVKAAYYIPYELEDAVLVPCTMSHVSHVGPDERKDAFTVLMDLGLKMATNVAIKAPACVLFKGREDHKDVPMYIWGLGSSIQTSRSFFPETWIWDMVAVGTSGKADVSLTVPDTITTWETEAFCLSSSGFGLAPPNELKAFQPFFLELSLPYSIVRGERFVLKATVFNYQSSCIMVRVTPSPSSNYTLTAIPGEEYSSCVCANGRKTFNWTMDACVLALGVVNVTVTAEAVASNVSCNNETVSVPERGRVDVITRFLIIKAEGTEVRKTYNWFLFPRESDTLTANIQLELPENVITGSASCSISVLGGLGSVMKNLDGLLRMPYGCGEQNMAILAPNVYILEYLKNTNQLTEAITKKAMPFLVGGYQRQLNFKHSNGAYSLFVNGQENTWLTAFVLRTLVHAKSFYNSLDQLNIESTIEQAKTWLASKRKPDGCFEQSGKLLNNRLKGRVSDEVTLSAYITASFLELNSPYSSRHVGSLSCLKDAIDESMKTNTYTTALLAYVFSLAGDATASSRLLKHLDKIALESDGGFLHWSQTSGDTSASMSVEISSYVVLAKLASPCPRAADLAYAYRIVRWLHSQQNSEGSFSSTQDTVVANQALSRFFSLVFSKYYSMTVGTVTVKSSIGEEIFYVNKTNRPIYQERALHIVKGVYSLEVKGTANVHAQMSLKYNIPTPVEESCLSIKVTPEADCSSNSLTLKLHSLYTGNETCTNMVLVDVTMLSGFIPHPESLKKLEKALLVDLLEQKDDHIILYLTELNQGTPVDHTLELIQNVPVLNLKPALVKIYDYYNPSDNMVTEYSYPCHSQ